MTDLQTITAPEVYPVPLSAWRRDDGVWVATLGSVPFEFTDPEAGAKLLAFISGIAEGVRLTGRAAEIPFWNGVMILAEPGGMIAVRPREGEAEWYQGWQEAMPAVGRMLTGG